MPSNPLPPTEIPHQAHGALDTYGTAELVAAFDAAARLLAEASGMLGTPAR